MSKGRAIRKKALRSLGLDFRDRAAREIERGSKEVAHEAVAHFSRGSVGTQLRDFLTKEDLERERKEARKLTFAD